MRRVAISTLLTLALTASLATAATPRASLTDIENDVMCVACHEPLAVSQSPQGEAERNYIRSLIAQGETKSQILNALVAQYGPAVLGRPPAHGFNLAVYIVPPAIVAVGLAILGITLPRWRRRTRNAAKPVEAQPRPRLDAGDAKRLEEELARYDG
jgi:cytochrome c-type biogenesis protein CcmH/NrfF